METNPIENMLDAAAQQPPVPEDDPAVLSRAQELITQAKTIQRITQADVLSVYNTDMDVRASVLSGQQDFVDVYQAMKPSAPPPAPVRSANGSAQSAGVNVSGMTDEQFARLNHLLQKGGKVDMSI